MNQLIRTKEKNTYEPPFTYEIYVPNQKIIEESASKEYNFKLVPADYKHVEQEDIVDVQFEDSVIDADKWDYIIASASGLITATLNTVWVGNLSLSKAQTWGRKEAERFVIKVAKTQGYRGNDLESAIRKLEKTFQIPSDELTPDFGGGLQHHLRDFSHHPSIVGLAFSILSQFTRMGYGTNTNGEFVVKEFSNNDFIGKNFGEKIFNGTVIWAFHLISDMAGSSGNAGAGTGIPGAVLSFFKEISALPIMKDISVKYKDDEIPFSVLISKLFNGTYFQRGEDGKTIRFDLRTEMGLAYQLSKQAVPVIANECIVRAFYSIRRLYIEIKRKKIASLSELKELDPTSFLPFNNKTIAHMTTVSSGTFVAVTTATAAVRAAVKNKGNGAKFAQEFLLSINYVGVGRFTIALVAEAKYVIKDWEKIYKAYIERQERIEHPVIDFQALEYLTLSEGQAKILLSLKRQKIIYDIQNTKDIKDCALKQKWLDKWEHLVANSLDSEISNIFITEEAQIYDSLWKEVTKKADLTWLYLVTMELSLFNPYYALDSNNKKEYTKLKCNSSYEKDRFCKEQMIISKEDYDALLKAYKSNLSALNNKIKKIAVGASVTVVATAATGGLAMTFAPQIAIFIAGESVAGLYGAALTNASLAFVGGGSLAAGGLGVAGGTAVVTGGGALIGLVGSETATVSSLSLLPSEDYILNECAKILTMCKYILIDKLGKKEAVSDVQRSIERCIDELQHEIKTKDETINAEGKGKKKIDNRQKACLANLKKCNELLKNMLK